MNKTLYICLGLICVGLVMFISFPLTPWPVPASGLSLALISFTVGMIFG